MISLFLFHFSLFLLQQCMLNEYYYAGVTFIDQPRYRKFFGPAVNQAKLDYGEQVTKYLEEVEQTDRLHKFDQAFDRVPDLEKPFFVGQMGWKLARIAEEKAQHAGEMAAKADAARQTAEARAHDAESSADAERKRRAAAEHEANRQKNSKHLRKRQRQAKERRKKKK